MVRRVILSTLKTLVPRPRGTVEFIEISGTALNGSEPIRLSSRAHPRIDQAIAQSDIGTIEIYQGDVREIDLDNRSFVLRNAGQVLQCSLEDDLIEAAKQALDRRVQVSGNRMKAKGRRNQMLLRVNRLEILNGHHE